MTVPDAFNLAIQRHRAGRLAEAARMYRAIIAQQPDHAESHYQLGCLLKSDGKTHEALASFETALALRPASAQAMVRIAEVLYEADRFDLALQYCRRAVDASSNFAEAHHLHGMILRATGELTPALAAYEKALLLNPALAPAACNIGNIYFSTGQLDEAVAAYRRALAINPDWPPAWNNLAGAQSAAGQVAEAKETYEKAIARWPNLPLAHYNLAEILLRQGDLLRGFAEYEWRWDVWKNGRAQEKFGRPRWTGDNARGRRLLLVGEQGFGDMLQFIRYIPLIIQHGAEVVLACEPALQSLLKSASPESNCLGRMVSAWATIGEPLPDHDLFSAVMSLPRMFRTSLETIPATVPYLWVDPARSEKWHHRLAGDTRRCRGYAFRKVGLVWAGRGYPDTRHLQLSQLAPLAEIPGIRWISLQVGTGSEQAKTPPPGLELTDWTSQLNDFADTAALIDNLDLVITIDTAVAHLAGAMGKPVWTLLKYAADWRWLLARNDSPWYPTMRLFRQARAGNWEAPLQQIVEALHIS